MLPAQNYREFTECISKGKENMYGIDNLNERKKACEAFWENRLGRPLICVTAPKAGGEIVEYDSSYVRRVREVKQKNYDSMLRDFDRLARNTFYGGESFPVYTCDFAPDQYASFYGGQIEGQEGQYTTWVHKIADTAEELDCRFKKDSPAFVELIDYIARAAEFANGNFLINMLDLHSNLDTLSALLGPENLCMELLDDPDAVERKLWEINASYAEVYEAVYRAGRMDTLGSIGWHPIWSKGRTAVVQCDFSCMISPEMARKYVIPSVEREAEYLDHCVYHYDGKQALGHFEDILAISAIDCVQWVPGDGEKRTLYWMDLLHRIQEVGKKVWIYDWTAEEILADKELIPDQTVFSLSLPSEDEAKRFLDAFFKKYR